MRLRRQLFLASLATFILLHIVLRPLLLQVPDAITNSKHAADVPPQTLQIISSTSPPPPPPRTTSYAACARIRSDRLLVYAAHSGFGNQELSLRRALLVSYVLNRTLVLPPILKQSDLAFGPPEVRCRNGSRWQAQMQRRAEQLYIARATGGNGDGDDGVGGGTAAPPYESLRGAYDFLEIESLLGTRLVDFNQLLEGVTNQWEHPLITAPVAPLGCSKSDRYTYQTLRAITAHQYNEPILKVGSTYFLKAHLQSLRSDDGCFDHFAEKVLALPHSASVQRMANSLLPRLQDKPFASIHIRLADSGVQQQQQQPQQMPDDGAEEESATAAHAQLSKELRWLSVRLSKRLHGPSLPHHLYIATNIQGGVNSDLLAPLCGAQGIVAGGITTTGTTAMRDREPRRKAAIPPTFNCSDLNTLGGLPQQANQQYHLSTGTASLLIDQAIASRAARGFYSTSKFCGPPGFRKSTFSEGIALRWQLLHAGSGMSSKPLCAHAMEYALLQGKTARGEYVY